MAFPDEAMIQSALRWRLRKIDCFQSARGGRKFCEAKIQPHIVFASFLENAMSSFATYSAIGGIAMLTTPDGK
jgi:hypothetical protein